MDEANQGDGHKGDAKPPGPRKPQPKDPASMHHEGSFGKYMEFKNLKLREQFDEQAMGAPRLTNIFANVTIHVNGYTNPSHQELKQLMTLHGGRFENYFSPRTVTHIICNNLPDTKLKRLAHQRKPLPIVKPDWVVASIKARRLLPVTDFLLDTTRLDVPGQSRLTAFATHEVGSLEAQEMYPALAEPQSTTGNPGPTNLTEHGGFISTHPGSVLQHVVSAPQTFACTPHPHSYVPNASSHARSSTAQTHEPVPNSAFHPPGSNPLPYTREELQKAQELAASLRAQSEVLRGPHRSSKDDPNFVNTFFKASRLHFIGTWKARIEDLFSNTPAGPSPTPYTTDTKPGALSKPPTMLSKLHSKPISPGRANKTVAGSGGIGGAGGAAVGAGVSSGASGLPSISARWIVHLDMDCFFASAALPGRPVLRGKPLAVSHSNSTAGSGEVSTANYEARRFGVRSGMFIADAKRLCPDLVVVPYEFDRYQHISDQVYKILLRHSSCVQPISCDEAFLDITGLGEPEALTASMRAEIVASTECTASAGIAPNMLLARLATGRAKPNGQLKLEARDARKFLAELPVDELPGVGWAMKTKLEEMGIQQVQQLWGVSRELLQRQLGAKNGLSLWRHAQGLDERRVEPPRARKSVGAEINYGIRMSQREELKEFMDKLVQEVCARLTCARVKGRTITLKVKRRQVNAPEPLKFMGHGACDNISRSVTLPRFSDSPMEIGREAMALMAGLQVPIEEVRGLGITVTKLDNDATSTNARPSGPAPAKVAAPPRGTFNPSKHTWWLPAPTAPADNPSQQQQQQVKEEQQQDRNKAKQDPGPKGRPLAVAGGQEADSQLDLDDVDEFAPQQQAMPVAAPSTFATTLGAGMAHSSVDRFDMACRLSGLLDESEVDNPKVCRGGLFAGHPPRLEWLWGERGAVQDCCGNGEDDAICGGAEHAYADGDWYGDAGHESKAAVSVDRYCHDDWALETLPHGNEVPPTMPPARRAKHMHEAGSDHVPVQLFRGQPIASAGQPAQPHMQGHTGHKVQAAQGNPEARNANSDETIAPRTAAFQHADAALQRSSCLQHSPRLPNHHQSARALDPALCFGSGPPAAPAVSIPAGPHTAVPSHLAPPAAHVLDATEPFVVDCPATSTHAASYTLCSAEPSALTTKLIRLSTAAAQPMDSGSVPATSAAAHACEMQGRPADAGPHNQELQGYAADAAPHTCEPQVYPGHAASRTIELRCHSADAAPHAGELQPHSADAAPHKCELQVHSAGAVPHTQELQAHSAAAAPCTHNLQDHCLDADAAADTVDLTVEDIDTNAARTEVTAMSDSQKLSALKLPTQKLPAQMLSANLKEPSPIAGSQARPRPVHKQQPDIRVIQPQRLMPALQQGQPALTHLILHSNVVGGGPAGQRTVNHSANNTANDTANHTANHTANNHPTNHSANQPTNQLAVCTVAQQALPYPPPQPPLHHPASRPAGSCQSANDSIAALPPASELDPEVLDQLPLALKRELELAYNVRNLNELHSSSYAPGKERHAEADRKRIGGTGMVPGRQRGGSRRGGGPARRGRGSSGLFASSGFVPLDRLYQSTTAGKTIGTAGKAFTAGNLFTPGTGTNAKPNTTYAMKSEQPFTAGKTSSTKPLAAAEVVSHGTGRTVIGKEPSRLLGAEASGSGSSGQSGSGSGLENGEVYTLAATSEDLEWERERRCKGKLPMAVCVDMDVDGQGIAGQHDTALGAVSHEVHRERDGEITAGHKVPSPVYRPPAGDFTLDGQHPAACPYPAVRHPPAGENPPVDGLPPAGRATLAEGSILAEGPAAQPPHFASGLAHAIMPSGTCSSLSDGRPILAYECLLDLDTRAHADLSHLAGGPTHANVPLGTYRPHPAGEATFASGTAAASRPVMIEQLARPAVIGHPAPMMPGAAAAGAGLAQSVASEAGQGEETVDVERQRPLQQLLPIQPGPRMQPPEQAIRQQLSESNLQQRQQQQQRIPTSPLQQQQGCLPTPAEQQKQLPRFMSSQQQQEPFSHQQQRAHQVAHQHMPVAPKPQPMQSTFHLHPMAREAHYRQMDAAAQELFAEATGEQVRQALEQCVAAAVAASCGSQTSDTVAFAGGCLGMIDLARDEGQQPPPGQQPLPPPDSKGAATLSLPSEGAAETEARATRSVVMLKVAAEIAAQWGVGQLPSNLEEVRRVLLLLARLAAKHACFQLRAQEAIDVVQAHALDRYGFVIAMR